MTTAKQSKSFIDGPIFFRLTLFALPIMLTGLLQVLYNTADNIVVGSFSGDALALGAVGSTGTLTNLLVNLLMGIATGVSVVISQCYGAREYERASKAVHTAMTFALIGGAVFALIGLAISEPALALMGTKAEFMSRAVTYFRIICIGIPATIIYNFAAAILRAVGNSKTPLFVLSLSGLVNVGLNLVFVIGFHMSVAGVALATIISQYISAVALMAYLMHKRRECYGITLRRLGIEVGTLKRILRYGIPTGLQSSLFSISNLLIVSAGNSLSATSVSARTIISSIDTFAYTAMNCYSHAALTFVGQNYGAGKMDRVRKSAIYSIIQVLVVGITISQILILFSHEAIGLFLDPNDPNRALVEAEAIAGLNTILSLYFMCGLMETMSGALRGIGMTVTPTVIAVISTCGIRLLWIYLFFYPIEAFNSLSGLYLSYHISWAFSVIALGGTLATMLIRLSRRYAELKK